MIAPHEPVRIYQSADASGGASFLCASNRIKDGSFFYFINTLGEVEDWRNMHTRDKRWYRSCGLEEANVNRIFEEYDESTPTLVLETTYEESIKFFDAQVLIGVIK